MQYVSASVTNVATLVAGAFGAISWGKLAKGAGSVAEQAVSKSLDALDKDKSGVARSPASEKGSDKAYGIERKSASRPAGEKPLSAQEELLRLDKEGFSC